MATREEVMARINMHGVLRSITELVALDDDSRAFVEGKDLVVEFVVRGGPRGALVFSDDRCTFTGQPVKKADIRLLLLSPRHFNRMMDGKANPIPLKGFTKIGFLTGPFAKLTDRLSFFLRPEDGALQDPDFFAVNTRLTAFVAFHSLSEVGNWDDSGRASAAQVPDGVLQVKVEAEGGPAIAISADAGRLSTSAGEHPAPRCLMWFRDLEALSQVLNGEMETFTIFAQGRAGIRGYVPMADKMNPILGLLPNYLS